MMDRQSHEAQAWASVAQAKDSLRKVQRGKGGPPSMIQLGEALRAIHSAIHHTALAVPPHATESKEAG